MPYSMMQLPLSNQETLSLHMIWLHQSKMLSKVEQFIYFHSLYLELANPLDTMSESAILQTMDALQ